MVQFLKNDPKWDIHVPGKMTQRNGFQESEEKKILENLHSEGYLGADIAYVFGENYDSSYQKQLVLGPKFTWIALKIDPTIPPEWLRQAGWNPKKRKELPANSAFELQKKLLETAENYGYPFAKVRLDSLSEPQLGAFSANMMLDKGRYITFGDLQHRAPSTLPKRFLEAILGMKSGDTFSPKKVLAIENRLTELPFLQLSQPPTVSFIGSEAQVQLVFSEKKANRFDFLIGLLPQPEGTGRALLTGSADVLFHNILNQGERFELRLERLRPETQRLDAVLSTPFLMGLPFGISAELHIHKRDSSFLDAQARFSGRYLFANGDKFEAYLDNKSSAILRVDTQQIVQTGQLPATLDYKKNAFGLVWRRSTLDYILNPRRGFQSIIDLSVGINQVGINPQIEQLQGDGRDYRALYDGLTGSLTRYQTDVSIKYYLPIFKNSTLLAGFRGLGMWSEQAIFTNELYRIGGTRTLRGFDEESVFVQKAGIATLEYRLLLGRDAFLAAFTESAYLESKVQNPSSRVNTLAFGTTLALQTGNGQFTISIANGKIMGSAFDLRGSKFHLGFVSLF